jgi:SRSO17 transposase
MMIERAVAAGIPFGWVTADEAYGDNGPLRSYLEGRGISCVLAVARAHVLATPAGGRHADALASGGTSRGRPSWPSTSATRRTRPRSAAW